MEDINFDDLLGALLEEELPSIVETPKVIFKFHCTEDNETYYPDVITRRRYGGYKPPKAQKVKFINPFEKKIVEKPAYMKQLTNAMSRIELRESDKHDTKIKYIKKKYSNAV
jgi:hypothetical protein